MPRAFCPECAAEVPVDEQGRCFLGHEVPGSASSPPDPADDTRGPEPWVVNVTAEDVASPVDEVGSPRPEPSPGAPTGEGEDEPEEEVELDLDTLERAVTEMGITADEDEEDEDTFAIFEERPPRSPTDATAQPPRPVAEGAESEGPTEPEVEVHEDAVADVLGTQDVPARPGPAPTAPGPEPEVEPAWPEPTREPEPAQPEPTPTPQPEPPAAEPEPDEWVAFDEPARVEEEQEPDREPAPDEEPEPVDTANFLARPKGERRGLFGR